MISTGLGIRPHAEAGGQTSWRELDLPHDWSIEGPTGESYTRGGHCRRKRVLGKTFVLDPATTGKRVFWNLTDIPRHKVLLNGNRWDTVPAVMLLSVMISLLLHPPGTENTVEVTVDNSKQPNSDGTQDQEFTGTCAWFKHRRAYSLFRHIRHNPEVSAEQALVKVNTGSPIVTDCLKRCIF